jgi:hypothetical protein
LAAIWIYNPKFVGAVFEAEFLLPDQKTLYVANSDDKRKIWMRYDVAADGTVNNGRMLSDVTAETAEGLPDGLKVDTAGNVYATGPGSIWVFAPDGKHIGSIEPAEVSANAGGATTANHCTWTARPGLYWIKLSPTGQKQLYQQSTDDIMREIMSRRTDLKTVGNSPWTPDGAVSGCSFTHPVFELQRRIGNRAVGKLLRSGLGLAEGAGVQRQATGTGTSVAFTGCSSSRRRAVQAALQRAADYIRSAVAALENPAALGTPYADALTIHFANPNDVQRRTIRAVYRRMIGELTGRNSFVSLLQTGCVQRVLKPSGAHLTI